jgi:peptide deformylase
MARLPILEYPDPRLRLKSQRVEIFDGALARLIDDLFDTLYASGGIGLAAPQVNVPRQVVVLDISGNASGPALFINPVILADAVPGMVEESCLSVPGVVGDVPRATHVRVRAQARDGQVFERDLDGLLAVCLQHEMDHLRGRLFIDHLSMVRRLEIFWTQRRRAVAPPAARAS